MIINLILIFIILGCAGTVFFIIWQKIPKIRSLDVGTVPEAQADKLRDRLLLDRMRRGVSEKGENFQKIFSVLKSFCLKICRAIPRKIFELEKKYQDESKKKNTGTAGDIKVQIGGMLQEAKLLLEQEKFNEAEKKFIEVVSLDAKNLEAYKGLTEIYYATKEFKQAKETAGFLLKIMEKSGRKSSVDENGKEVVNYTNSLELAVAYSDLADIHRSLGDEDSANRYWQKALELEPNSPRYLDKFIESCIILKQKSKAFDSIKKLEEVNPENQKIQDFYEKLKTI